jgi:hypothetical protein
MANSSTSAGTMISGLFSLFCKQSGLHKVGKKLPKKPAMQEAPCPKELQAAIKKMNPANRELLSQVSIGSRIEVFWVDDNAWYEAAFSNKKVLLKKKKKKKKEPNLKCSNLTMRNLRTAALLSGCQKRLCHGMQCYCHTMYCFW